MKTKKTIQTLVVMFLVFAAGVMVGLTLTNPGMSLMEVAGTIGRVDQYRNVKITEADIELRNQLLSDEKMRDAYVQYLTFEYANNIQMADNISYALMAADAAPMFRAANARTLSQMEDYAVFLDNVRLKILEAMTVISDLSDKEKVAVRTVLNDAGNTISQTITRSNAVYNYLTGVEDFFHTAAKADFPQLVTSRDRLFANLMAINLVNENRPVLEYLLAKGLMDEESLLVQQNMESLRLAVFIGDAEKLGLIENEETLQLLIGNMEQLQGIIITDSKQLQGVIGDGQKLGIDAMQGLNAFDKERLSAII